MEDSYNSGLIVQIGFVIHQENPAGWVETLVVVLHPLLSPLNYLLYVALQVLRSVAWQLVDDVLTVGLHGLFIDGLEDLTLHVVL